MLVYLIVENINPIEYFDANRILKLKDKLTPEVGRILDVIIKKLKKIASDTSPKEFLK